MRSSSVTGVLLPRGIWMWRKTHREGKGGEEIQGRQRQAEATRSWDFAMELSKRLWPRKHFIFGLLAFRTRKRYDHSKPPTLWHFVSVALGKSSTSSKPLDYPVSTMLQGSPSYPSKCSPGPRVISPHSVQASSLLECR